MKNGLLLVLGIAFVIFPYVYIMDVALERHKAPKIANSHWDIEVTLPKCDDPVKVIYPERMGDVLTVYCEANAVEAREHAKTGK